MKLPRIMIAAPKSGSGKTMLTCVLLELLKNQNKNIFSVKAGPDFIDPLFHETVQGVRCFNLDTFFTDKEMTSKLLYEDMITCSPEWYKDGAGNGQKGTKEQAVHPDDGQGGKSPYCLMEGVMGLYDGIGGVELHGSSYELAQWTQTPVILLVDAKGAGRSLLAVIAGMLEMDTEHLICGVILNRISKGFYPRMKELIESELDISVFGFLPEREELTIKSRYLGLVLPDEIANLSKRIKTAADIARDRIDMEAICRVMESAEDISGDPNQKRRQRTAKGSFTGWDLPHDGCASGDEPPTLNLAVAKDEAFCFYYRENLRRLSAGAIFTDPGQSIAAGYARPFVGRGLSGALRRGAVRQSVHAAEHTAGAAIGDAGHCGMRRLPVSARVDAGQGKCTIPDVRRFARGSILC